MPARAQTSGTRTKEKSEAAAIRSARLAQNRAIAAGDTAEAARYWTDDVEIRRGLGPLVVGRAAYQKILLPDSAAQRAGTGLVYERTPSAVDVSTRWPLAYESGNWAAHLGSATGAVVIRGRYSAQWVKSGARWLIRGEVYVALSCAGVGCNNEAMPATAPSFAGEIAKFEADDRTHPPTSGGILFFGSSSFRLWPDIQKDFPGVSVLNRGFGGSTFPDVRNYYAPRVVLPARPPARRALRPETTISPRAEHPHRVARDYATFAAWLRRTLPDTRIVYVSIKPSPSRWSLVESIKRTNALIASQIARDSLATYVDVFTPMIGSNGRPMSALFVADSLHDTCRLRDLACEACAYDALSRHPSPTARAINTIAVPTTTAPIARGTRRPAGATRSMAQSRP